jgi:hypothetical protein
MHQRRKTAERVGDTNPGPWRSCRLPGLVLSAEWCRQSRTARCEGPTANGVVGKAGAGLKSFLSGDFFTSMTFAIQVHGTVGTDVRLGHGSCALEVPVRFESYSQSRPNMEPRPTLGRCIALTFSKS